MQKHAEIVSDRNNATRSFIRPTKVSTIVATSYNERMKFGLDTEYKIQLVEMNSFPALIRFGVDLLPHLYLPVFA